ncbi:MAG: hypothetical protein ACI4B3_05355, partial [Prevotella sp.]
QQDLDCPLVSESDAGGKEEFMALCDARLKEWEEKVKERRNEGFLHFDSTTVGWKLPRGSRVEKDGEFWHVIPLLPEGNDVASHLSGGCLQTANREFWFDGNTGYTYIHRPIVRYRGFVKLLYDGDVVYVMNIHEERFIAYHNWEIRADDSICTIGNKLYLRSDKDGKALRIRKRSGDFQMFVVNEPIIDDYRKTPMSYDAQMMIINKYGKGIELKHIQTAAYEN